MQDSQDDSRRSCEGRSLSSQEDQDQQPKLDPSLRGDDETRTSTILTCKRAIARQGTSRTAYVSDPPEPDDPLLSFAPYIHKQPRRNSITPDRQRAFIAALAATGIVTQAARSIGASMEALYKLRGQPGAQGFARAWEEAIDRGIARLEDCALERALLGEERPVVSMGRLVTTYRRFDTQLLLFLLRERRRHRYGPSPASPADEPSEAEIYASIDAKLDRMREAGIGRGEIEG